MSKLSRTRRRIELTVVSDLDAIYARIPKIDCKGDCHTHCGLILMGDAEAERIAKADGQSVSWWARVNMAGDYWQSRKVDPHCPKLTKEKRCSVYAVRPAICRLWGVTEDMPCVYGCKPERILSKVEAGEIIRLLDAMATAERRLAAEPSTEATKEVMP